MEKRVSNNGELDIWRTAVETPESTTFQQGGSQSQSQQIQSSQIHEPERHHHRVNDFSSGDLGVQALNASFGRLSFTNSRDRQNSDSVLHNQVFSGGGGEYLFSPNASYHRELELNRINLMRQNVCVNRSYGFDTNGGTGAGGNGMLNNGSLNGVSYFPRNLVSYQNPWNGFGSGVNNAWRINHGQMEKGRGLSILSMARDQVLRQLVQKNIVEGSKERFDVVFNCLIVDICDLMVDPFGNDVVKTLIDKCSSEHITQIVDIVTQDQYQFINICLNPLGTMAIQSLLGKIKTRCVEDQVLRMVRKISMVALELTRSINAKDVILTCFTEFTFSQCTNLLEVVARNFYEIAIDQNGCCMLQQCLDKYRIQNHAIKQRLITEILAHALRLCLNCHGNYIVQFVAELDDQYVTEALVKQLLGNYAYLARNKYGSHVVQKLLKLRGINSRLIICDMVGEIDTLLLDPFGNYVIQTAWFVSQDDVRYILRWHIEHNIRLMRCNKFGNKILEKLNL